MDAEANVARSLQGAVVLLIRAAILIAAGCTYDYDRFESGSVDGAAPGTGGSAASTTGGTESSGGASGGAPDGAASGSGGTASGGSDPSASGGVGAGGERGDGGETSSSGEGGTVDGEGGMGADPGGGGAGPSGGTGGSGTTGGTEGNGGEAGSGCAVCDSACVDLAMDALHCGSCGNACSALSENFVCLAGLCGCSASDDCLGSGPAADTIGCESGVCSCDGTLCVSGELCHRRGNSRECRCNDGDACGSGQVCCPLPGGCVDLDADPSHCGACGRACAEGESCSDGECG